MVVKKKASTMTRNSIDEVVIIYNPNSTGNSAENAKKLRADLKDRSFKGKVTLRATKYPRHGEKIAATYANKKQKTLLVSSSGDGGYHEVINGILSNPSKNVIAGLLPSGNANDHFTAIGSKDVVADIIASKARYIDVLKIETTMKGRPWTRYAHSYLGVGISPVIGKELTKTKLNVFNEKVILIRELLSFDYVTVEMNGRRARLTSLICANINTMSKVLKLSKKDHVKDGKFEVSIIEAGSKAQIMGRIFQASTLGLKEKSSTSELRFKTIKATPIQLDGEVYTIDSDSEVKVTSVSDTLSIII